MGEPPRDPSLPSGLATPARLACFDRATFVRDRRDELVAAIADGDVELFDVFEGNLTGVGAPGDPALVDDAIVVATTKILPLVEAVPHMGKVTSRRLLASLSIAHATPVERLDATERNALVVALDDHLVDQRLAAQYEKGLGEQGPGGANERPSS